MTNRGLLRTTLLLLAIPSGSAAMEFGPGEAAGGSQRVSAGATDFKVLVWYRRDDALRTFKYQVYDVRKRRVFRGRRSLDQGHSGEIPGVHRFGS